MQRHIDSAFFSDGKSSPWNERWVGTPRGVSVTEMNEVSKATAQAFQQAIDDREIIVHRVEACDCGAVLPAGGETLSTFDRFGMPFSTIVCRTCGLVRLDPFIAESSLSAYYDRFYHPLHFGLSSLEERAALFKPGQGHRIWNLVARYCPPGSPLTVLEIGAGTGSVLSELETSARASGRAVDGLGTELSHECVRIGAERGVQLIYGGFDEVVALGRRFDVVILSHVFEHFTDLCGALRQIDQVLADGGIVYIEVPGIMVLHARPVYRFDYVRYVTHAHVYHFNLTSLAAVLARNGFSLLYGNEEVHSVFTRGRMTVATDRNYGDLTAYLRFLAQAGESLRMAHTERDRAKARAQAQVQAYERAQATLRKEIADINAVLAKRQFPEPLRRVHRWVNRWRTR